MSNAWDRAADMADRAANEGGIYVKLADDGDKAVGAIVGDPHPREVIWTGEAYEPYDPNNPAHKGKRPSLKVSLNFFVPGEGMKIIEMNNMTFRGLIKVKAKYGLGWLYEIQRNGKARDPKTTYTILPEREIDGALRAEIDAAQLHDLANVGSGDGEDAAGATIAEAEAEKLAAALRRLPRSAVDAFLSELKVTRIRDVRATDLAKARGVIARFEAQHAPKPSAEVDPFA